MYFPQISHSSRGKFRQDCLKVFLTVFKGLKSSIFMKLNFSWASYHLFLIRLHYHLRLAPESTQIDYITKPIPFTGGYMYLEASLQTIGEKARLLSGYLTGTQCMRFKYHMMGPGIGTLRVHQISKKGSRPRVIWYRIGNQGEDWRVAQFNLFGTFYKVGRIWLENCITDHCSN